MSCEDCNRTYGHEHGFPDLIIPSWVWRKISPTGDLGGLLCPSCICKRLHDAGITCAGAFMSGPIRTVSPELMETMRWVENMLEREEKQSSVEGDKMKTYTIERTREWTSGDMVIGSVEVRIEYAVTYWGCEARISGPPEGCYPAEAPEFEIKAIWIEENAGEWSPLDDVDQFRDCFSEYAEWAFDTLFDEMLDNAKAEHDDGRAEYLYEKMRDEATRNRV